MNLNINMLDLPVEILLKISDYLDIPDILKLIMINKKGNIIFQWKITQKLREYVLKSNMELGNIYDMNNIDVSLLMYILVFIQKSMRTGDSRLITISIIKTSLKNYKFSHSLFTVRKDKCIFFVKHYDTFDNSMDKLEICLLNCKINGRLIRKCDNIYKMQSIYETQSVVKDITLHRINYCSINEDMDQLEKLTMVTFYLFI